MNAMKHLLDQPKPHNLQSWAWQAMIASFPHDTAESELHILWGGILQYIGWLDSLPMTHERS